MGWNYTDGEYVKTYRKIMSWEWYTDVYTYKLFSHCILKANWKPGTWKGIPYERGQFITSLKTLENETGLTIKQLRTAFSHLIRTGEITSKGQSKYRIVTVNNYDAYQGEGNQNATKGAGKGQDKGRKRATDIRTYKNNKEDKEVKKEVNRPPDGTCFEDDYELQRILGWNLNK